MKTQKVEGIITALSPIHHGGDEKTGAEALLRRLKFIVKGKPMEIPYISGNAVRGYLRRLLMRDFLSLVEYTPRLRLHHALMSGGVLEEAGREEGEVNIALRRKIRETLPPVSLFGVAIRNQAINGKLVVGHLLPICQELSDYLSQKGDLSIYDLLTFSFGTRREERPEMMEEMEEEEEEKMESPVQMLYSFECFAPGTQFYHYFVLLDTTKVEEACFWRAIQLWHQRPFVGGRSAVGLGEVQIGFPLPPLMKVHPYLDFLRREREAIVKTLEGME